MTKRKKPNLKEALKKVDKSSKELFGEVDIELSSLPCFTKPKKEKITANFDADLLGAIRELAKKNKVSYTTLMNDVLRRVFLSSLSLLIFWRI